MFSKTKGKTKRKQETFSRTFDLKYTKAINFTKKLVFHNQSVISNKEPGIHVHQIKLLNHISSRL